MKRYAILWLIAGMMTLFGGRTLLAQNQIEKDLEVGKNLLSTALRMDRAFIRAADNVNGQYIPGLGAVYMLYKSPTTYFEIQQFQPLRGVLGAQTTIEVQRNLIETQRNMVEMERNMMEMENQALAERRSLTASVGSTQRSSGNPIIILNGMVLPNSTLANINLKEVEKMEVLKGEAAGKIAGSRGQEAGVISITTKNPEQEVDLKVEVIDSPNINKALDDFTLNFMADHSFLFTQLPKDEHFIIVHQDRTQTSNLNGVYVVGYNPRASSSRREYKLSASDIKDFQSGKIDREALKNKISFKTEESKPVGEDVILFANVMHSLYPQAPMTGTFFSTTPPTIESLPFQTLTLNWRIYTSSPIGDNRYQMGTFNTNGKTLSLEERNEMIEKHYPTFIAKMKENMIDYGRTLQSLEAEQTLKMQLVLTDCNCQMPSAVSLELKIKDLMDYSKGNLPRADALKRITVREK